MPLLFLSLPAQLTTPYRRSDSSRNHSHRNPKHPTYRPRMQATNQPAHRGTFPLHPLPSYHFVL